MKRMWQIWKYALGSFNDEETRPVEDQITIIRTIVLLVNLLCAVMIMANIIRSWS